MVVPALDGEGIIDGVGVSEGVIDGVDEEEGATHKLQVSNGVVTAELILQERVPFCVTLLE